MERTPWWRGQRGEWYVVGQAVLFALIAVGPRSWPSVPQWPEPLASISAVVGITLMLLGAPLAVVGLISLGRPNLTALPHPTDTAQLRQSGPYALVRHPIYSGLVLAAFGWGLYLQGLLTLVFSTALFVLFDFKSRREERWLTERFPEYRAYCSRVKKLVPWLY